MTKSVSTPRPKAPSVSEAHLAATIVTVKAMDVRQKEQVCDRIHTQQPSLLSSVLALPRLGVSMQMVDVLLNILIVLILAVDNSGQRLATVTEADQERELQRLVAILRFSEGLDAATMGQSVRQTTAYKRESVLLAYAYDEIQRAGLTDVTDEAAKYAILAAINLANCIASAKRSGSRA